jgi:O-antigen biosynthesis protein
MKILIISYGVPRPDQTSGELRFFTLMSLLARDHAVAFYSRNQQSKPDRDEAITSLARVGVDTKEGALESHLSTNRYDVVFIEFYFVAEETIDLVRAWQPTARIIVDSVDVHFNRLRSKARLTGLTADHDAAETIRRKELAVYARADLVVTVSDEDSQILRREGLATDTAVIPNIHVMHSLGERSPLPRLELIFIGSYKWAPNIDAMIYFCSDVMPLLRDLVSSVRLRIVGSSPTVEVQALARDDVEVVGFVEETTPYLLSSEISIAPLRYGGGIKGKIGEAMAHGVPVVTTAIGAEGFGLQPGKDLLIGDTPEAFCEAILSLWHDKQLHETVRRNAWTFINDRFSVEAVDLMLPKILLRLKSIRTKRLHPLRVATLRAPYYIQKHISWRFKK